MTKRAGSLSVDMSSVDQVDSELTEIGLRGRRGGSAPAAIAIWLLLY